MSELSREQIERIRGYFASGFRNEAVIAVCDMALRTHDAEQRTQRAEAVLRCISGMYRYGHGSKGERAEAMDRIAREASAKSPPESEPSARDGVDNLLDEMAADIDSMSDEEIRAESSPGEAEEVRRVIESATAHPTPEQAGDEEPEESAYWRFDARKKGYGQWKGRPMSERDAFKAEYRKAMNRTQQTGDALADDLDGALDCLYTKAMRDSDLNGPDAYAISQAYDLVRRHLTASGVPYVPENREEAIWMVAEIMDKFMPKPPGPSDGPFEFQPKFARDALYRKAEHAIDNAGETALASAPADGWKLVPVEPTEEMLEAAVSREIYDEIVGDGNRRNEAWTQYKAMIAAAPQRGGEHG